MKENQDLLVVSKVVTYMFVLKDTDLSCRQVGIINFGGGNTVDIFWVTQRKREAKIKHRWQATARQYTQYHGK